MTGHLGRISTRDDIGPAGTGRSGPGRRPILAPADRHRLRRPISLAGMALGYLSLVAILSIAPFWHQGAPFWHQEMTADHGQPMVCTDFGGSR